MPETLPTIDAQAKPSARPDYQRPEYKAAAPARALCHALMGGTETVRALGERGLPKWPAEKPEHYKIRAAICQVTRYYQRTVQASVGMICATPPALADTTDALLLADAEDIDGKGTHLEVFARHVTDDAINGGFCAIWVDAPPRPEGLRHDQELALGLRPFWVLISADQILSWIVDVPDWKVIIADFLAGAIDAEQAKAYARQSIVRQVVLHEPTDVPSGAFGVECKDRYRVLALTDSGVTFAVWEKRKGDGVVGEHFAQIDTGAQMAANNTPFREIPLAPVYAGRRIAPFVAEPPLLALAELNLDHYQVSADRRYLMRLCHAPTLFLAGVAEEQDEAGKKIPLRVGPNSVLTSSDANAKATYVAADPNALQSSKEEKEELVHQMAALGMSFIGRDKRGLAETATGRALDDAAENASHATVARGLQDGLEQAWRYHAMYRGVQAPEVTVNTTYANATVDPAIAAVIWSAVAVDKLPVEAFVTYLQTGELPDDLQEQIDTLRFIANDAASADLQHPAKPEPIAA